MRTKEEAQVVAAVVASYYGNDEWEATTAYPLPGWVVTDGYGPEPNVFHTVDDAAEFMRVYPPEES